MKKPNTITLTEFKKKFSTEEAQKINEEIACYDLLAKIKLARENSGMTQEELALHSGVNRTTLSKIETGVRNATIGTLIKLSQAMGLTLEINFR